MDGAPIGAGATTTSRSITTSTTGTAITIPTTSTGETAPMWAMATVGNITRRIAGPCHTTIALRRSAMAGRGLGGRSGATEEDRLGTPLWPIADRTTAG